MRPWMRSAGLRLPIADGNSSPRLVTHGALSNEPTPFPLKLAPRKNLSLRGSYYTQVTDDPDVGNLFDAENPGQPTRRGPKLHEPLSVTIRVLKVEGMTPAMVMWS